MGETTTIGWTDKTHNEWIGCQKVTEAECGDCYAWLKLRKINWLICGGYSGAQERPMELSWARSLRDGCKQFGVSFFMKQLGSVYAREHHLQNSKGEDVFEFPEDLQIQEFPRIATSFQEVRA